MLYTILSYAALALLASYVIAFFAGRNSTGFLGSVAAFLHTYSKAIITVIVTVLVFSFVVRLIGKVLGYIILFAGIGLAVKLLFGER